MKNGNRIDKALSHTENNQRKFKKKVHTMSGSTKISSRRQRRRSQYTSTTKSRNRYK